MFQPEKRSLVLQAPAKVNLLLRVVSRRPDGYHELETWMQKLDLCDELVVSLTEDEGVTLACSDPELPADNTNLAWRAAETFLKASSRLDGLGVRIQLDKMIPAGAGLGGGSSDAGTVLKGLNELAGDEFNERQLVDLARPLGADVPFFAVNHVAVLATGIGDVMQPVESLAAYTFVLVNPGFHVSTRSVFENFALTTDAETSIVAGFRKHDIASLSLENMYNDLERITIGEFSEIEQIKAQLLAEGASAAMMSGSGPTVFGVFSDSGSDKVDFNAVVKRLQRESQYRVFVARACVGAWPSG